MDITGVKTMYRPYRDQLAVHSRARTLRRHCLEFQLGRIEWSLLSKWSNNKSTVPTNLQTRCNILKQCQSYDVEHNVSFPSSTLPPWHIFSHSNQFKFILGIIETFCHRIHSCLNNSTRVQITQLNNQSLTVLQTTLQLFSSSSIHKILDEILLLLLFKKVGNARLGESG